MKKYFIRAVLTFLVGVLLIFIIFLGTLQITDYRPAPVELIHKHTIYDTLPIEKNYTLLSWNIGYGGLGNDMDFFYDGGTKVRTSEHRTYQNLDSIETLIVKHNPDFLVLQEVDINSKRSYYINQHERFGNFFSNHPYSVFCYNYKIRYLPFPFDDPLARIESGLLTFAKFFPQETYRHAYKANFPWPKKLWMLDRAFLETIYVLSNGKKLHLINTHNTAFDDGTIRKDETLQLASYVKALYEDGNYILIVGDWNQTPYDTISKQTPYFQILPLQKELFPAEWTIAWDKSTPTNRSLQTNDPQEWVVATIDYAIASPNIIVNSVKTINQNFIFSDHNPIKIHFSLRN